ncbi:MAG: uroporphyrinogen-III synthase [Angustibacter sp.]
MTSTAAGGGTTSTAAGGGTTSTAAGGGAGQLDGFVIALTCDRRAQELAAAFTRRGAQVMQAPVLRIVPVVEDAQVHDATRRLIEHPPDDVVVTTAIGFRGWVEAADAAGLAPDLLRVLGQARILARGPKGRGAIRAAGLVEAWSAQSETTAEVVRHLLDEGVAGRRIAVQQHGLPDAHLLDQLTAAGAELETVRLYRWDGPPDPAAVQRVVDATAAGSVDAVVFTSAPGSQAFLDAAATAGRSSQVLQALRSHVVAAAVGPVTAGPLVVAGLDPVVPDRYRLGALVRALADHLATCRVLQVCTPAGVLQVRGQGATLDGRPLALSPVPLAVLRELCRTPGQVVGRPELLAVMADGADAHAVEMAIGRLRAGLGRRDVVQTVVKRGYRLAVPAGEPAPAPFS